MGSCMDRCAYMAIIGSICQGWRESNACGGGVIQEEAKESSIGCPKPCALSSQEVDKESHPSLAFSFFRATSLQKIGSPCPLNLVKAT